MERDDPISDVGATLGTASVVGKLIDVVHTTISSLYDLHGRWKDADFTLINLISQLTALRAGLDNIHSWISSDQFQPHHQLIMDLEVSISCCRMVMSKLSAYVADLRANSPDSLDFKRNISMLLKDGSLDELSKMLERQVTALTLLLTACSCTAMSAQRSILEEKSSRRTIQSIRDDTSSLYVQRDDASIQSHWTGTLSKISRTFDFDRELFISKVYDRALRGSLKNTVQLLRGRRESQPTRSRESYASIDERKPARANKPTKKKDSKKGITVLALGDMRLRAAVFNSETRFTMGSLSILLFNPTERRLDAANWAESFEHVSVIVFCVDLICYDLIDEDTKQNKMRAAIEDFHTVVNLGGFTRTSIVLLLCNRERFQQKIRTTPLSETFSDYIGGTDMTRASRFILKLFSQLNTTGLTVYPYFTEVENSENVRYLFAAIKEGILNNVLQESSILKKSPIHVESPSKETPPDYASYTEVPAEDKVLGKAGDFFEDKTLGRASEVFGLG